MYEGIRFNPLVLLSVFLLLAIFPPIFSLK